MIAIRLERCQVLCNAKILALETKIRHHWLQPCGVSVRGVSYSTVNALLTNSACSAWWMLYEPVAGLAEGARPTYFGRSHPGRSLINLSSINVLPPMFCGSSCAHIS